MTAWPIPRAGQPAAPGDLVNVAKLVTAYYTVHPDPGEAAQRVSFGTSGHRGSAFTRDVQRGPHPRHHPGDLRVPGEPGHRRPAVPGRRHARALRAGQVSALEVLAANGVRVLADARGGYTPTPAVSRAILEHNAARQRGAGRRDRGHPLAQPAAGRRLQVQPARRRAGRHRHHQADPGPGERAAQRRAEGRAPDAVRAGGRGRHDRHVRLPRQLRGRPRPRGRPGRHPAARASASAPTRSAGRASRTGARSASATDSTSPWSTRRWTRPSGS